VYFANGQTDRTLVPYTATLARKMGAGLYMSDSALELNRKSCVQHIVGGIFVREIVRINSLVVLGCVVAPKVGYIGKLRYDKC
jgi:hypothetical protein